MTNDIAKRINGKRISQMREIARVCETLAAQSRERADLSPEPMDHGYCIGKASGYEYAARMLRAITEDRPGILSDSDALDSVAHLLRQPEWENDTIERVAEIVGHVRDIESEET